MMSVLQRLLMRLYGTSEAEQDERTREVAQAVRERAAERREELGASSVDYSQSVVDAYRSRVGREQSPSDSERGRR